MLEFTEVQIINLIEMCSPLRFEEGTQEQASGFIRVGESAEIY